MLVVSDIDDVFLPKPNDLLVNIAESRASLEALLGRIGEMYQDNSIIGSAMGPALQAGFKLMVGIFNFSYYLILSRLAGRRLLVEKSLSCPRLSLLLARAH